MSIDPRDSLDWNAALQGVLNSIRDLTQGKIRLYRIEPQVKAPKAAWLEQALAEQDKGHGRWFTDDPEALLFYVKDQALAQPTLLFMDVDVDTAQAWRVNAWEPQPGGEDPRRFSRDPEREYFLPSLDLRPTERIVIPEVPARVPALPRRPRP